MSLPSFTKLGAKLSTPSWLTALSLEMMFPRIFYNDAYRSVLSGLPSSSYSCLYSSNHSPTTGYIGRADFSDIEGTWTDFGAAIHSGSDQRETPHPVFDAANSRVNVYVHDVVSAVTFGSQAARLTTSTTLASLTDQGEFFNYGNHTGYGEYRSPSNGIGTAGWEALTVLIADEVNVGAFWTGGNGVLWSYQFSQHPNASHILGIGNCNHGVPRVFQWHDQWYQLGALVARPRLGKNADAIIAYPLDPETLRPTGGYYTLIVPGASGASDEFLNNTYDIININDTLYLLYEGNNAGGTKSFMLAKSTRNLATQVAVIWPVFSDGDIEHHVNSTSVVNWDAANDPFPSSLTRVIISGIDVSNQVVGSYYELKTGSGSAQNLYLRTASVFDPTAYETVEFEIQGIVFTTGDSNRNAFQFGFTDALPAIDSVFVFWSPLKSNRFFGELNVVDGGVTETTAATYSLPYNTTASTAIREWTRSNPFDLKIRLHDYGRRMTLFVDGHVAYHRDISNISWATNVFCYLRLIVNLSPFSQFYARFTRVAVTTYTIAAPTGLSVTSSSGHAVLAWNDPIGSNLRKINIYRSEISGGPYTLISGNGGVALGVKQYTDRTAIPGKTYFYVITAVDDDG